jgi:DNA transformation protein and related proteins
VPSGDFLQYVEGCLGELPFFEARRMFGGWGLYSGTEFFGIVMHDVLYLRTDEDGRADYEARGSKPFRPNERQTSRKYYEVPEEVVQDEAELLEWARDAVSCAAAARAGKR